MPPMPPMSPAALLLLLRRFFRDVAIGGQLYRAALIEHFAQIRQRKGVRPK